MCLEKTYNIRLRSTETQPKYTVVLVEVGVMNELTTMPAILPKEYSSGASQKLVAHLVVNPIL